MKDKAKLLYEVESLNKLNEDLNEEVRALQVQLEQERSKSHAAMTECRKLIEVRNIFYSSGIFSYLVLSVFL